MEIEYSIDNGAHWKSLTTTATNLSYLWKNIPKPASAECKIRIRQAQVSAKTDAIDTLGMTLGEGHKNYTMKQSVWSPEGDRVASADNSWQNCHLGWYFRRPPFSFIGHSKGINSIAWSPDGFKIATASDDYTAKVWDATTGKLLVTIQEVYWLGMKAMWNPDGSKLVVGVSSFEQKGMRAKIWDANTGTMLLDLTKYVSPRPYISSYDIKFLSWSPDGTKIAVAISDLGGEIWDAATGKFCFPFIMKILFQI